MVLWLFTGYVREVFQTSAAGFSGPLWVQVILYFGAIPGTLALWCRQPPDKRWWNLVLALLGIAGYLALGTLFGFAALPGGVDPATPIFLLPGSLCLLLATALIYGLAGRPTTPAA